MATAPTYCTHRQLKDAFPQVDSFDSKKPLYGWKEVTTNKYASHNSGLTTQLFADGEDLGPAQSAHTDLNVEGEWFYNSAEDITYYYSATDPNDKLMEAGEEFSTLIARVTANASRYVDSRLDPNLVAASFMIKAHDATSEIADKYMEEADTNFELLNSGKASLSWQTTGDSSKGVIRDVNYTSGKIRPVDTRGRWNGSYDLIKVKIITGGVIGTATYSVWTKDGDALKNNQVVTAQKITGDYQTCAQGLEIRFSGADMSSTGTEAVADDEWEIEVSGYLEEIDSSNIKSVKMTRGGAGIYGRGY
jgi:hypothetical protein